MILHCTYEELQALTAGAELVLSDSTGGRGCAVAAPSEVAARVELLLPRLNGDISITTLAEQRQIRETVALIYENLRTRLEGEVVEHHPAHEDAVLLYFDYAHVLKVLDRLDRMGGEMSALVELMSGASPTPETAAGVTFPD